jgi:hypothetical protein
VPTTCTIVSGIVALEALDDRRDALGHQVSRR